MSPPRDSLRDVLGSHLERAEADAEAERKARSMVERDALRDKLDAVRALPSEEAARDASSSERREHLVVSAPSAPEPRRDTARKIKIDPRIDPRLLATERHAPPPLPARSRARVLALGACVGALLVIGAVLAATRSDDGATQPGASSAAPSGSLATAAPGTTAADATAPAPASAAGPSSAAPTAEPAGLSPAEPSGAPSASPVPTARPTDTNRRSPPAAVPPRKPTGSSPTKPDDGSTPSPPPPGASTLKPLGGAGPTY